MVRQPNRTFRRDHFFLKIPGDGDPRFCVLNLGYARGCQRESTTDGTV